MVTRYGFAVGVGAAVTFALLFIMQLLIASGRGGLDEKRDLRLVDFVRVERDVEVDTKKPKPEKPPEPQEQPQTPRTANDSDFDNGLTVAISTPTLDSNVQIGDVAFGISDGEYLPLTKVTPVYPSSAQTRGLEGYSIVEYTVTQTGATKDVRVVESSSSVFERPCMEAAKKFKYRPRVIDGEAVEVTAVRNQCTFELDD